MHLPKQGAEQGAEHLYHVAEQGASEHSSHSYQSLLLILTSPRCQVAPHFLSEESLTPESSSGSFHPLILLCPGNFPGPKARRRGLTLSGPRVLLH